jgi:hypothetical protein
MFSIAKPSQEDAAAARLRCSALLSPLSGFAFTAQNQ